MKKTNLVTVISLALLASLALSTPSFAKSDNGKAGHVKTKSELGEPGQSANKRQKTAHSDRKAAAQRLKADFQLEHEQHLKEEASAHEGYTGLGKSGDSRKKQTSLNGGVK